MSTGGADRPPRVLERLCALTLPSHQREIVLGDLAEEYARRAGRSGARAANVWYVRELLRSLGPTLGRLPARVLGPRAFRTEDLVAMTWFALIAVLVAAFLFASRLH